MNQKVLFTIFLVCIVLFGIGECQSQKTIEHMTVEGGKAWNTFKIIAGIVGLLALIGFAVNGWAINKKNRIN